MISPLKQRKPDTHKGDYGHVLVIAGSIGMTGAAYLTSRAAVLSGAGLVTCGIAKSLNSVMEVKLTEAMTVPLEDDGRGCLTLSAFSSILNFSKKADVVAIGPGLSTGIEITPLVKKLLLAIEVPVVLDADGINAIAKEPQVLTRRRAPTVITPHPGEMAQLLGRGIDKIQKDRKKVAMEVARRFNVVTVLKGYKTVIADPDKNVAVNVTGNPGMASGGCGDVLTGIIAALIGQGVSVFDAARFGAYVHGAAGDLALKEKGELSLCATDLLKKLPEVLKRSQK